MRIYTNDPAMVSIGAGYLKIASWSYLLAGASQCYLGMMKIAGRVKQSAVIALIALLSNILLDIAFVYGLCGLPRMEAAGAAAATVGVCFVEFAYVYWEALPHVHPDIKSMLIVIPALEKDFFRVALPVLASALVWGIGFSAYFGFMGHINPDASAAYSISSILRELVNCIPAGASGSAAIVIGHLLGAGKIPEAKEKGAFLAKLSLMLGLIAAVVMLMIGTPLMRFFVLTPEAERYLHNMLLISSFYMFGRSLNLIVVCGIFPAGGDTIYDSVSTFISMWLFAVPLAVMGAFYFHWSVMVVYLLVSSDEIIKLPFIYPRYKRYYWLRNLTRETV